MGTEVLEQENLCQVGKYPIKNGWELTVREYEGYYKIDKAGVYGIWATRTTGGLYGDDDSWTIRILDTVGNDKPYLPVVGVFDAESCNLVIDIMEALMARYQIMDYSTLYDIKTPRTLGNRLLKVIRSVLRHTKVY